MFLNPELLCEENRIAETKVSNTIIDSFENSSSFSEAINFLIEDVRATSAIKEEMYENIEDMPYDKDVVNESVKKIYDSFANWIKKVIEWIKRQIDMFFTALDKWINSNKFVKGHIDELSKFTNKDSFYFTGYQHTFPDGDDPLKPIIELADSVAAIASSKDMKDKAITKAVVFINNTLKGKNFEDPNAYISKCRAEILGRKGYMPKETFDKELKAHFRNGAYKESKFAVNKSDIDRAISDSKVFSANKKAMGALKTSAYEYYTKIDKCVSIIQSRMDSVDDTDGSYDNAMIVFSAYLNGIINITKAVNSDVMLYIGSRLDAIKESAIQDSSIAYKAIISMRKGIKSDD